MAPRVQIHVETAAAAEVQTSLVAAVGVAAVGVARRWLSAVATGQQVRTQQVPGMAHTCAVTTLVEKPLAPGQYQMAAPRLAAAAVAPVATPPMGPAGRVSAGWHLAPPAQQHGLAGAAASARAVRVRHH